MPDQSNAPPLEPDPGLQILVVEDEKVTAHVIRTHLEVKLEARVSVAYDCNSARELLGSTVFDLVTLDYQLPDGDGLELLEEIAGVEEHPPVIMMTGHGDEQVATDAFKLGAAGYVVKDARMGTLLIEGIERAVELRRAVDALKEREQSLRLITDNMVDAITQIDRDARIIYVSPSVKKIFGFEEEDVINKDSAWAVHPDDLPEVRHIMEESVRGGARTARLEYRSNTADRTYIWIEAAVRFLYGDDGAFTGAVLASRDISDRKRAEALIQTQRDLAVELGGETDIVHLIELALNSIMQHTGLDCGVVYVVDKNTLTFDLLHFVGLSDEFVEFSGHFESSTRSAQLIMQGEPLYVTYEKVLDLDPMHQKEGLRFIAVVPLRYEGEVVGSLNLGSHTVDDIPAYSRVATEVLGGLVGQAIGRSRLLSALKESEERYRLLYDEMGEPICTYDRNLTLIGLNRAACDQFGYKSEELIGRNVFELGILHEGDLQAATEDIQRLLSGEDVVRDQYRLIAKNGEIKLVDVTGTALRDESGEIMAITNVVIDKTAQAEAEEALRKSEELYSTLLHASPDTVAIFDLNGKVLDVSEVGLKLFGYDDIAEICDKNPTDFVAPEDRGKGVSGIAELMHGSIVENLLLNFIRKDGSTFVGEVSAAPLHDRDGNLTGSIDIVRDVTERQRAGEELQRVNDELRGYAHTVSHDLKGPLATILTTVGLIESLAESGKDIADMWELIDILRNDARSVYDRVEELLSLAQAGQEPIEPVDVDVSALMSDVLVGLAGLLEDKKAAVDVDEDLGRIRANPTQMAMIFTNLVENALRHGGDGCVKVEVRYLGDDRDAAHRYLVRDNGTGLPPGTEKEVFAAFFKVPESRGAGIGLSIVERIVRACNGEIRAYNDGGACFEFTLRDTENR
jgi:PAS domain S-box-containing protein